MLTMLQPVAKRVPLARFLLFRATMSKALVELGRSLARLGYQFTTVTPTAQEIVNRRPANKEARSLRDIFGWSRPFAASLLPPQLFELMAAGEVLERAPSGDLWRSTIRFSTIDELLFAHSAFPTTTQDAVFLGPDSMRFVAAITRSAPLAMRIVDVGCGTGVGGIVLARRGFGMNQVVLADINEQALRLARVNAELAGVAAEVVHSDVLNEVEADVDLVVANPPYLRDDQHRWYRDGAGEYGEALGARIVREALQRLRDNSRGGTLLLYTGAPIVAGRDMFLAAISDDLQRSNARYSYSELDPDVFSDELAKPAYAEVERIAAVFLHAHIAAHHRP
jgi:methylase of polypeptide subunit release factors